MALFEVERFTVVKDFSLGKHLTASYICDTILKVLQLKLRVVQPL